MMIRTSKRPIGIGLVLIAAASAVVSFLMYDRGAGWPLTIFVSTLIVLFVFVVAWFLGAIGHRLWRLSTPRSLRFSWLDRSAVRLAKLLGIFLLSGLILFVLYRNAPFFDTGWGFLIFIATFFCLPTVLFVIRYQALRLKSPRDWEPSIFEMLVVRRTDLSIPDSAPVRNWRKGTIGPLNRVLSSLSSCARLNVIFPDFGLYRAFRNQIESAEEALLVIQLGTELTPRQNRVLRERGKHPHATSLLVECEDNALVDSLLNESLAEARIEGLCPTTQKYEQQVKLIRRKLVPGHVVLVLSGEHGPVGILAEGSLLEKLQARQHAASRRLRQSLGLEIPSATVS